MEHCNRAFARWYGKVASDWPESPPPTRYDRLIQTYAIETLRAPSHVLLALTIDSCFRNLLKVNNGSCLLSQHRKMGSGLKGGFLFRRGFLRDFRESETPWNMQAVHVLSKDMKVLAEKV